MTNIRFKTFKDFYPFYLSQHSHPWCRRFHFVGTCCVIFFLLFALFTQHWTWLIMMPVSGYFFAWLGHFFIEKNKPATFTYPLYSLWGDFVMFKDILTGKIKI